MGGPYIARPPWLRSLFGQEGPMKLLAPLAMVHRTHSPARDLALLPPRAALAASMLHHGFEKLVARVKKRSARSTAWACDRRVLRHDHRPGGDGRGRAGGTGPVHATGGAGRAGDPGRRHQESPRAQGLPHHARRVRVQPRADGDRDRAAHRRTGALVAARAHRARRRSPPRPGRQVAPPPVVSFGRCGGSDSQHNRDRDRPNRAQSWLQEGPCPTSPSIARPRPRR